MVFLHPERIDSASVGIDSSQLSRQGQSNLRDSGLGLQGLVGSLPGILLLAVSAQGNELGGWTDYFYRWLPDIDSN